MTHELTAPQIIGIIFTLAVLLVMYLAASSVEDVDRENLEKSNREDEEMP